MNLEALKRACNWSLTQNGKVFVELRSETGCLAVFYLRNRGNCCASKKKDDNRSIFYTISGWHLSPSNYQ